MTRAGDPLFVDTNGLLYATNVDSPWHEMATQAQGIRRLLTHNEADLARYAGVITVLPLSMFR